MRQLATVQKIDGLNPIPGADKIEVADVKGWKVVVQKDIYKVGDKAIFFEIDSLLPDQARFAFLKKGSTLKRQMVNGVEVVGIRLKTIKLKGQISQGLLMPISEFRNDFDTGWLEEKEVGADLSESLNVLKYEPPMPAELSGKAKGFFPGFIPKTDEERIQNMADLLTGYYVTEKLDGSSVTYFKKDGVFGVCSRNLELQEGETTQWRLAKEMDLPNKLPDNFALQGELVGEGIQKNPLKIKGHKVYFFNAYNISTGKYLGFYDFKMFFEGLGLEIVPVLDENYSLPKTVDEVLAYAEGKSAICPEADREGIVVRSKYDGEYNGRRLSFKAISNKYLLDTEE